jgi:hypothetical protein
VSLPPAVHNRFFHVGFVVRDLDAAMKEFRAALGIDWRASIEATVPLLGPEGSLSRTCARSTAKVALPRSSSSNQYRELHSPVTVA